jgi:hypothetical protein
LHGAFARARRACDGLTRRFLARAAAADAARPPQGHLAAPCRRADAARALSDPPQCATAGCRDEAAGAGAHSDRTQLGHRAPCALRRRFSRARLTPRRRVCSRARCTYNRPVFTLCRHALTSAHCRARPLRVTPAPFSKFGSRIGLPSLIGGEGQCEIPHENLRYVYDI